MTEAEWDGTSRPRQMLLFLGDRASPRKLRLFAVACCRRVMSLMMDERSWEAVEAAERAADGPVGELLSAARVGARATIRAAGAALRVIDRGASAAEEIAAGAAHAAWHATWESSTSGAREAAEQAARTAGWTAADDLARVHTYSAEQHYQAAVLRDLFRPFRPLAVAPAWRAWQGGIIPRLAQAAYDVRALPSGHLHDTRLAVLADALEECGCSDPSILEHLRGHAPHVRGCAVLDALHGKQ